ncbi:MAG: DUF6677 family protein, partial [Planctomycetaceae bacterium]
AYQGRIVKAAIYAVCVLGTFFYGMHLGDWQVVHWSWGENKTIGYLSQVWVGLPALPAFLIQSPRYRDSDNVEQHRLEEPIASDEFVGVVRDRNRVPQGLVTGTITLQAVPNTGGRAVQGRFRGTIRRLEQDGPEPIELELGGPVWLDRPIRADKRRALEVDIADARSQTPLELAGTVPRSFWNWFEVPHDIDTENELHRRLDRHYELAAVFTWIAGLLNLLAIWDALDGPAYGSGKEYLQSLRERKRKPKDQSNDNGDDAPSETEPAESAATKADS